MKPHLKVLWIAAAWPLIYISTASGSPLTTDYRQSSFTIGNVTYTTPGIYDPTDQYIIGAQETHWFANLQPPNPAYLISPNSGVTEYFSAAFPTTAGWSYAFSDSALSENSLVVHNYSVVGTAQLVGARFHVEYTPHGTDPTDNIHWIQVISNNHGRGGHDAPAHGRTSARGAGILQLAFLRPCGSRTNRRRHRQRRCRQFSVFCFPPAPGF